MLEANLLERIGTRDVLMGRDQESTHLFEHGEADFRDATDKLKPLLSTDATQGLYTTIASNGLRPTTRAATTKWWRCTEAEIPGGP